MTRIALSTLRARWVTFAGSFVALVLGVALVAAMGVVLAAAGTPPARAPERYAAAPVVIRPTDPHWDPALHDPGTRSLAAARGVPDDLVARIATVGDAVPDRTFYAQIAGGPSDQVGHAWSAAAFTPYTLASGRAPRTDGEIVVGGGHTGVAHGDRVTVLTAGGPRTYEVAGVTQPVGFESAVFFTDAEAARLSPRVDAVVTGAPAAAVAARLGQDLAGGDVEVLTGDDRSKADPRADQDREALADTSTLLWIAGIVAGFVAVFVVASTFALAVVQRQREIALLRLVGGTPKQVRRMLIAEAALIGAAASAAGCVLGLPGGRLLARWLAGIGAAPSWFAQHTAASPTPWVVLVVAFGSGLIVTLAGVWAASRRAGRVRPIEALRDAVVDRTIMTTGRRLSGLGLLALGITLIVWVAASKPQMAIVPLRYVPIMTLPVAAAALLAPVLVPPLARLVTWPLARLRGATGMLVRANALAAVRRTASTAAPVLLTVGLSMSLLGAAAMIDAAKDTGLHDQVIADYVITPDGTGGLSQAVVDNLRAVDGVDATAALATTIYVREEGWNGVARFQDHATEVVDPGVLERVLAPPMIAGSLTDLRDDTIVVNDEWGREVGDRVEVWLADGSTASLRVAAVVATTAGNDPVYLTPKYAATAKYALTGLAKRVYVTRHAGTGAGAVAAALHTATRGLGAAVVPAGDWVAAEGADNRQTSTQGMLVVLGIAAVFSAIAVVNTLVMATADRAGDLAALRRTGATPRQVLRIVAAESVLVVTIGVLLAVAATVVNLAGLRAALDQLVGAAPIAIPWLAISTITAACAAVTVLAAVVPARLTLRSRAPNPPAAWFQRFWRP